MATAKKPASPEALPAAPPPDPSDELKARLIPAPLQDGIYSQLLHIDRVTSMLRVTATFAREMGEELKIEDLRDVARTLDVIDPILTQLREALDEIAMGRLPGGEVRS